MFADQAVQFVPAFVLVFFRIAGVMVAAPLFGSARVPRRVKICFALVFAAAISGSVPMPGLPESVWTLAVGIGGELLFGLAIGTALSFTFVAAHWAGDIIGQQMGLGMGQVFDPQFGQGGSMVSDLYFMFSLVIFLLIRGHHAFLRGVMGTFESLPPLSVGMSQRLLDLVVGLLGSATSLAMSLAAPVLITMLAVEVVLGFISKTIPQVNVMTAGLSLRSLVGFLVLIAGASLASEAIRTSMEESMIALAEALGAG